MLRIFLLGKCCRELGEGNVSLSSVDKGFIWLFDTDMHTYTGLLLALVFISIQMSF